MWNNELKLAKAAARIAGQFLAENWSSTSLAISSEGKDIKLKGDLESEQIILDFLTKNSNYPILSEEGGKSTKFDLSDDTIFWVIDPLDGSLNYNRSTPLACISLALWQGQKPLLGVVYDFNRVELFSRVCGEKLCLNGNVLIPNFRLKAKEESVIATGFPSGRSYATESLLSFVKMVQEYKKVRLLGSAALSLAWVAIGRFDAYSEEEIYLWDIAGGLALIDADRIKLNKVPGTDYKYFVSAGYVQ